MSGKNLSAREREIDYIAGAAVFSIRAAGTYHVDNHLAQTLPLLLREVVEHAAVFLLHELEAYRQVMVLQHRFVVVHQRQFGACECKDVAIMENPATN